MDLNTPASLADLFAAAWNAGDASGLGPLFTEDADFTAVNGLRVRGRDLIVRGHDELLRTLFRGTELVAEIVSVRDLAPALAAVEVEFTYPKGILPGVTRSLASYIARLKDDRWEIVVFRNMIPFERPVAGPVEREVRDRMTG